MAALAFVFFCPHHPQKPVRPLFLSQSEQLRKNTLLQCRQVAKRSRAFRNPVVPHCSVSDFTDPDGASTSEHDAAPTDVFKIGDIVSERYKIRDILGRGANGVTYEAELDTGGRDSNAIVALKVLSLRGMRTWKALELFHREGSILRALDHPAIPSYVDSFEVSTANDVAYVLVQRKAHGRRFSISLTRAIDSARIKYSQFASNYSKCSPISVPCSLLWCIAI